MAGDDGRAHPLPRGGIGGVIRAELNEATINHRGLGEIAAGLSAHTSNEPTAAHGPSPLLAQRDPYATAGVPDRKPI